MSDQTQNAPDLLDLLDGAAAEAERIVGNVRPDQWDLPTPCTEWSVRDVVNHLVGGNLMNVAAFDGPTAFSDEDHLGDDPVAALAASNRAIAERLRRPGAMGETATFPYGTFPGQLVATFRVIDLLNHGWDIAKATGQPTDLAPDLHTAGLALARPMMAHVDRTANPAFGLEQPAPAGASAADAFAAFMGRAQ